MRRVLLALGFVVCMAPTVWAQNGQPVLLHLVMPTEDPVNWELTAWRVRQVLGRLQQLRGAAPKAGVTATVLVSGSAVGELAADKKTADVLTLLQQAVKGHSIVLGYRADHEPTYETTAKYRDGRRDLDWPEAARRTREFYSAYRPPIGAKPDPKRKGGLTATGKHVKPLRLLATHVGLQDVVEIHTLERMTGCRVRTAFAEPAPASQPNIFYADSVNRIRRAMSPSPDTSPDAFWFMGQLILATDPSPGWRLSADGELDDLRDRLEQLDRTRVAVRTVWFGTHELIARVDPIRFAYGRLPRLTGDKAPDIAALRAKAEPTGALPTALQWPTAERSRRLTDMHRSLEYLAVQFLPANPESGFVNAEGLLKRVYPCWGDRVTAAQLKRLAVSLLDNWRRGPPDFAPVGERYVSLAQAYDLLLRTAAHLRQKKRLRESLEVRRAFGPLRVPRRSVVAVERKLTADDVGKLLQSTGVPAPSTQPDQTGPPLNRVPETVAVQAGEPLPCPQVLWALAKVVADGRAGALTVPATRWVPPLARAWVLAHPGLRRQERPFGLGQLWTLKPAQFRGVRTTQIASPDTRPAAGTPEPDAHRHRIDVTLDFVCEGPRRDLLSLRRLVQLCDTHKIRVQLEFTGRAALALRASDPRLVTDIRRLRLPIAYYGDTALGRRHVAPDELHRTPREWLTAEAWKKAVDQMWQYETRGIQWNDDRTVKPGKGGGWLAVQQVFNVTPLPTGRLGRGDPATPGEWVLAALGAGSYRYTNPWPADVAVLPVMRVAPWGNRGGMLPPTYAGSKPGRDSLPPAEPTEWLRTLARVLPRHRPMRVAMVFIGPFNLDAAERVVTLLKSDPKAFRITTPDVERDQYMPINSAQAFYRRTYGLKSVDGVLKLKLPEELPSLRCKPATRRSLLAPPRRTVLELATTTLRRRMNLSREQVCRLADEVLTNWPQADEDGNFGGPPPWLWLDGQPVCLADAFDALLQSVVAAHPNKALPEEVTLRGLRGPVDARMLPRYTKDHPAKQKGRRRFGLGMIRLKNAGQWNNLVRVSWEQGLPPAMAWPQVMLPARVLVDRAAVAAAAAHFNKRMTDHVPGQVHVRIKTLGKDVVLPGRMPADGFPLKRPVSKGFTQVALNSAEFLYLLAQVVRATDGKLPISRLAAVGSKVAVQQEALSCTAFGGRNRAMMIWRDHLEAKHLDQFWTRTPAKDR